MRFGKSHGRRLSAAVLLATCWFAVGLADLVLAWPEAMGDSCYMGCAVEAGERCCCMGNSYGARHAADHQSAEHTVDEQPPMAWWQPMALACQRYELTLPTSASGPPELSVTRDQALQLPPALAARVAAYDGALRAETNLLSLAPRPPPSFV